MGCGGTILIPRSPQEEAMPPFHQYAFMVWCLVKKAQGQLLFIPSTGEAPTNEPSLNPLYVQ
jgi:hypothetical protein